jgi:hypothetical protein
MPFEFFLFLLRGNVEEVAGKTAKGTRTQEDRQPHEHILVFKTPKAVWLKKNQVLGVNRVRIFM